MFDGICRERKQLPYKTLFAGNGKINFKCTAYDRILKVSRTIAYLAESADIKEEYLAEGYITPELGQGRVGRMICIKTASIIIFALSREKGSNSGKIF